MWPFKVIKPESLAKFRFEVVFEDGEMLTIEGTNDVFDYGCVHIHDGESRIFAAARVKYLRVHPID